MWKNYPSVAWSQLKLTLYVICKEKCNHRAIVSVATANPPFTFLSFCLVLCILPTLHFFLFPSIILHSTCLVFFIPLFLSVASFYARCLCHFLPLCVGRFLFFCFVVTSPLSSVFCHFLLSSCRFAHCHRHTNTDINKSSFCEVPEVRDEYDFQNPQKNHLHRIFTVHYLTWIIILAHLAESSKLAHQTFLHRRFRHSI